MKLTISQRIFLAFSSLLVVILGLATGITYYRGNDIAQQSVRTSLENIRVVQQGFEARRFQQLELISEIFASDPYFSSYVAEATGGDLGFGGEVDSTSIADQLIERQQNLGFDFAMVLSDEGEVIAHTNNEELIGEDLTTDTLVGSVIESLESSTGYWFRDEAIYQIAVVTLADEQDLVGFLITGLVVDNKFVEEIKRISGSELVFLKNKDNQLEAAVGTLGVTDMESLLKEQDLVISAKDKDSVEVNIDGDVWLASIVTAGNSDSGGITVALTSFDDAAADFRAIQNVLLIVAALSVLLAIPLSLLISRGVLSPVRRLASAAQAAARGDYQQRFEAEGTDELARLRMSFDTLLSDLREKNDMQGYMADLAKYLPDSMDSKTSSSSKTMIGQSAKQKKYSLVGIDLRRFAKQADKMLATEVFDILNANLQNIDSLAKSYLGNMVGMIGHRVLIVFDGDESYKRAFAMAGNTLNNLMSQGEGVSAAVVQGNAVLGTAEFGDKFIMNCLGSSVYQLDRLLQESVSGHVFYSPALLEEIKKEIPDYKPLVAQGLSSKSKFYVLKAESANIFRIEGEGDTLQGTQVNREGESVIRSVHVVPGMSLGGRYEIISELGAGGMGVVYKAHDYELDDLVALKMLKLSGGAGAEEFLDAMKSEIRLARKITHPSVLRTYDYGELDGVPYISMEYVRGLTLKYLINQSGKIPYSAGLQIAKQLAAGLNAAHEQGVLHRDIKPENIILEHNGNAKLMDFGIARQVTGAGLGKLESAVVGTPRFAAPEQLEGKVVDERADIYSSGVVLYNMYTGEFPHGGRTLMNLVKNKTTKEATLPSKYWEDIPKELEDLIMSCLQLNPEDRISSAAALLDALEKLRA
jgi:eukaryotic-like serine/threonine-protein kinase